MLEEFVRWIPNLASGLVTTVVITILGGAGAFVVAIVCGLLSRSRNLLVRTVVRVFIETARGIPLFVVLFWLFYALPLMGVSLDAFTVALLALSLNNGAYGAEVVRGAINSVPRDQWDAVVALNLHPVVAYRRVIFPQALVMMIAPMSNLWVLLLKSTPLVYTITLLDITGFANEYRAAEGNTVFIYLLILVLYFLIAQAMTVCLRRVEARAWSKLGRPQNLRATASSLDRLAPLEIK
jgi:polar amino acid transport system permease protein